MGKVEEIENTIRTRFKLLFDDVESYPVQYDNAPFSEKPDDSPYVTWHVEWDTALNSTLGDLEYRYFGTAIIEIWVPIESGTKVLNQIIDKVTTVYRSVTDGIVQFRTPRPLNVGVVGEKWRKTNVLCPWQADEVL